jgi:hypothetical protein
LSLVGTATRASSRANGLRTTWLLGGRIAETVLACGKFEQAIRPLLDRSIAICERALDSAGLNWKEVDQVISPIGQRVRASANVHSAPVQLFERFFRCGKNR